ncbi:MAG: lycopene beta cyclase [Cyanobacteriota bacterium]
MPTSHDPAPVDVLVVGAGPAALAISAALVSHGLTLTGLAEGAPEDPWPNTYGIWGEEVDRLGLAALLEHRWSNSISDFGTRFGDDTARVRHQRDYGLFDRRLLQEHWLAPCRAAGMTWHRDRATALEHHGQVSTVTTASGNRLQARLVVDASGHEPVFVRRPDTGSIAGQAAYGIVGRFSAPPVEPEQFVLMDYRADHLSAAERLEPPTFLYAMDLGEGRFFVEETSLALAPPVPFDQLRQRLERRLAQRGVAVLAVEHEDFCLFPMNLPLPDLEQPVVGFGGAASMVHPASGYLVGALLRRAPALAAAIAAGLGTPGLDSAAVARLGWQALWPPELRRKHALYQFGLEKLMRFEEAQLRHFFATFFSLPQPQWSGFLANTLSVPELVAAMVRLFAIAPADVRWGLFQSQGRELSLVRPLLWP